METLASGYGLIEGPVWSPAEGLLFSDVMYGGVFCLPAGGGDVYTALPHRRGIGGMALHEAGGLIVSGRNISFKPLAGGLQPEGEAGKGAVLLDESAGPGVVGFNDLTTDPDGRIYAGSLAFSPITPGAEEKPGHLHMVDLDGSTHLLASGIQLTNGLGVSPDGGSLYHSDSRTQQVWRYGRSPDGSLSERAPFGRVPEGIPDGLAVAEDGAVWVAVADGSCVLVYEPDGAVRQRIEMPTPMVTSVCFGGPELRELYIVTGSRGTGSERGGAVYRMAVDVPGLPLAPARVALP